MRIIGPSEVAAALDFTSLIEALERELLATQAQLPRAPSGLPVQRLPRD